MECMLIQIAYIYVITEKHYVAGIRGVKQPETHL